MDLAQKILSAAARQFEEHGFRGATTRRIAETAGVNEVTLFRHFGSKERLLREALVWAASRGPVESLPAAPADPEAELVAWSAEQIERLHSLRSLIRTCMGEFEERPEIASCAAEVPQRLGADLRRYLELLIDEGMAARRFDVHAAANVLMGAVFSDAMSRDMMPERFPYPVEEAPGKYVRLFLRGIGVPCGED